MLDMRVPHCQIRRSTNANIQSAVSGLARLAPDQILSKSAGYGHLVLDTFLVPSSMWNKALGANE